MHFVGKRRDAIRCTFVRMGEIDKLSRTKKDDLRKKCGGNILNWEITFLKLFS